MDNKTKVNRLSKLPLWECDGCHRLEFSEPTAGDDWGGEEVGMGPLCPDCEEEMNPCDKDSVSVFEAIGQHFHRDTGYVRPGKDCRIHDDEVRAKVFQDWNWSSEQKSER